MAPVLHFPVFEANQVLTSGHLNDVFDYLDGQTRLTRSKLIGIGIVCGLEIKLDTSAGVSIQLSRGCGVTSEGYLIVQPDDVSLVAYRPYELPTDIDYPALKDAGTKKPYPLWELFPAGEPRTTAVDDPAGFLDGKAVLLFLELKKEDVRSCSPNNCDDKGSEVTVTVRRLLIDAKNLDKIISAAHELGTGLTSSDLDAALSAKLNLPDVHVPRFDVLNSGPVTSNDVYAGLLNVFRDVKLANATDQALKNAYAAFKPLLQSAYPADPFGAFQAAFSFLDTAPASATQVRFLQYYVDLFEDLLYAYDEFRWRGVGLLCACCPPEGLFPRHLMLGLVHPEESASPGHYRHVFLSSPALGCCSADAKEVVRLFARLVEMAARFTNTPSLPNADGKSRIDPQIRITPSVLGDRPLQAKAIPYYYREDGTPPLYHLWNGEKTRRNRANQNLSYRYDEYNPSAPAFTADPLRFDLEPYNFLRIEGHLGKRHLSVLSTLLLLKSQYRLPIDVIALRTGPYDDSLSVDLAKESARFQDLEALYDSLREELLSALAAGAMDLYDAPVADSTLPGGVPKLQILKDYARHYRYPIGSVGATYEKFLQRFQATPYIDVDQTLISDPAFANDVLRVYCTLFNGVSGLPGENFAHVVCLFYFSKLAEILPASLDQLGFAEFENKYQDLVALARYFRSEKLATIPPDLQTFVPQEELVDQFEQVLFRCKLEPIRAVHSEYAKRLSALKKRQFLSNFLQQHPGIQHKAGVPIGGTFILVYHQDPAPPVPDSGGVILNTAIFADRFAERLENPGSRRIDSLVLSGMADLAGRTDIQELALTDAIARISSNSRLLDNADVNLIVGSLTGRIPMFGGKAPRAGDDPASKVIASTVNELDDGTVIADFFLPYRLASDCPGIEFVLPKTPPSFKAIAACTNVDGTASVTVTASGGTAPYDISIDQGAYQSLEGSIALKTGPHTLVVRDADGVESPAQPIDVAAPLRIGPPRFVCEGMTFTAEFEISGGTMPYTVNGSVLQEGQTTFKTDPAPSGTAVPVVVMDSQECRAAVDMTFTCAPDCTLPCRGISLSRGFRFWLPEPDPNDPYTSVTFNRVVFAVDSGGNMVDLSAPVRQRLRTTAAEVAPGGPFQAKVKSWLSDINTIIIDEPTLNQAGTISWLTLGYEQEGAGQMGTLMLEYFECLTFDIQIDLAFRRRSGLTVALRLVYSPRGTTISVHDRTSTVPPLEGRFIDKCDPAMPSRPICPVLPPINLRISPKVDDGNLIAFLAVTATPPDPSLTYLWEIQDGTPAVATGSSVNTRFEKPGRKLVTVTAFTDQGCRVTRTSTLINVGPIG